MSLEEWDRQLRGMTREEYAREKRREAWRAALHAVGDIIGALTVCALLGVFGWLCATASGYNWE